MTVDLFGFIQEVKMVWGRVIRGSVLIAGDAIRHEKEGVGGGAASLI